MAKRGHKKRKTRSSGGGCCPTTIVFKCKMKRTGSASTAAGDSIAQRLAKFKEAQAMKREQSYNASFGGLGNGRNKRAADAARAARHAGTCTVKFGSHTSKRMNPVAAAKYIAAIRKRQHAKNCLVPAVVKH